MIVAVLTLLHFNVVVNRGGATGGRGATAPLKVSKKEKKKL